MAKKGLLLLILVITALQCGGCATILGGIIGYQSAELAAGLAIGAAVDFGDDIARGVGQMAAKKENFCRDFETKGTLNAKTGEITLPIVPFNQERITTIVDRLQNTLEQNGWSRQITKKCFKRAFLEPLRGHEKWKCTTSEQESFELEIKFNSNHDTTFRIHECAEEKRIKYTCQLYNWLKEGICTSAPPLK
jgi:hypothetical protein